MDRIKQRSRRTEVYKWFKRKHKRAHSFHFSSEASDDYEDESVDYTDEALTRSLERIITNNLRIFVGTWNVGGRSPVGSLTVDLDEWLNLNPTDAADLYVLGFQEIVPLKTRTIIGAEDPTEATNWSRLIGKTLNDKYGCPWLTPMLNSVSSDNYRYTMTPQSERVSFSSHPGNPIRECLGTQDEKPYKYKLMASKKMVGVFIGVWMKKELLRKYCISNVKVSSVPCGIMGWLGNKGSVSVSMSIEGTTFCFIAAHLASGEKKGDEVRRNRQVSKIFRRTTFPRSSKDDDIPRPVSILGHDNIFWLGDLNYRLYLEDNFARNLIKKQDWRALQEFDQLRKELEDGGVFQGWSEGNIEFAPTYKYSASYFNRYSGSLPSRSGEKQRTPAWCDRILWYGKGVRQLSYFRSESKFSDHRPVSALFSIPVENVKSSNPRVIAAHTILPRTSTSKPSIPSNSDEKAKSTLLSLIAKDIEGEASLTYKRKAKKKRKEESP